jgi:hypothetical protein
VIKREKSEYLVVTDYNHHMGYVDKGDRVIQLVTEHASEQKKKNK